MGEEDEDTTKKEGGRERGGRIKTIESVRGMDPRYFV